MCVWKILEASVALADEAGFVEVLPNVVPHLLGGGNGVYLRSICDYCDQW